MNNKRSVRQIRGGQALAGKNRCDIWYRWAEPRDGGAGIVTWDIHRRPAVNSFLNTTLKHVSQHMVKSNLIYIFSNVDCNFHKDAVTAQWPFYTGGITEGVAISRDLLERNMELYIYLLKSKSPYQ